MIADTASGARRSVVWDSGSGFVFFNIEGLEDTEDSSSDSETETRLENGQEVVGEYQLYTSFRVSLGSGTIKSSSRRDWRYLDDLYAITD